MLQHPLLVATLVFVLLHLMSHYYGALGVIVLVSNPFFLLLVAWLLLLISGRASATRHLTGALAAWMRRSIVRLQTQGIVGSNEMIRRELERDLQRGAARCIGELCATEQDLPPYYQDSRPKTVPPALYYADRRLH